ncbi:MULTISPECIES: methyltransferase domain-containing protein [unclassified Marinobacter]|uniref:spermidine synthase n=1 Tax=unclassified Marinobacter TaxID=83889 RepID=UPI000C98122D|nr:MULTISPECIES: methyltransferase domain-containing protein [unclassified Marinobacter]MAB53232.1 spermidine synthase [Marinobacter sp.]
MKGEIIHYTRDALGGILVVDYRKHRVMTFDSVFEQSKIDRRRPHLPVHEYSRAMLLPVAFAQPAHATILGLGGGVMASALLHLLPECQVHAVELRPRVLEVAREYFSLPHSANLTMTIGDARDALGKAPDGSSDLILADMYNSDRMSPAQAQRQFIRQCSRVLGDDGWLAINYHRTPDINGPLFHQLRAGFAVLLLFKSKTNNTVIFASKRPFEALHTKAPSLVALENRLPIDWRRLMGRVIRLN